MNLRAFNEGYKKVKVCFKLGRFIAKKSDLESSLCQSNESYGMIMGEDQFHNKLTVVIGPRSTELLQFHFLFRLILTMCYTP